MTEFDIDVNDEFASLKVKLIKSLRNLEKYEHQICLSWDEKKQLVDLLDKASSYFAPL